MSLKKQPVRRISPADLKHAMRDAILLAGVVMLIAVPMFVEHYQQLGSSLFTRPLSGDAVLGLALKQAVGLFGLAWLCALVGFLYAPSLGLIGLRKSAFWHYYLLYALAFGVLFSPLVYITVDRFLLEKMPAMYPATWYQAILEVLATSFSQEVILRFGLTTIIVYWVQRVGYDKHLWFAALLPALLAGAGFFLFCRRYDLDVSVWGLFALSLPVVIAQLLYGMVYLRYGLLAAIGIHIGINIRYVLYTIFV
jgi:hypothetical protein